MIHVLSLLTCLAVVTPQTFQEPEADNNVIAWWHWLNGNITQEGITRDLESMKSVGINQATFLNVWRDMPDADVPNKSRFNSPEWWHMVRWAMQEASRLDMTLGAANCDGWSESGGPWITPEMSMKHYVFSITPVSQTNWQSVSLPMPDHKMDYYRDVAVLMYPEAEHITPDQVIDVTQYVDVTGQLRLPSKVKQPMRCLRFGYTTTGKTNNPATWEGRGLECDKMDTVALNLHWANYPQKVLDLAREVNPAVFRYFLVDSWEAGPQTWTRNFPAEFQSRRGYDMTRWIPALCGQTIIDTEHTEAFLHDYRMTIGDLVENYYFKHMSDLCHRNGVQMYSEGIYGEKKNPPVDVLKTYKYCDVPMTEFWARVTAKDIPYYYNPWPEKTFIYPIHSSLLYGKTIIGSEAYTGYALYSDSPIDLKSYGDAAFCEGVNSMMLHSYVHQPTEQRPGMTLGVYGQSFNRHNTWFPEAGTWFKFQARVQHLLRQGMRRSDVLVYTGDELPCPQWTPQESDSVMQGLKFNYINPDVLLSDRISVRDGQILLDGVHPFQCLVLRHSEMELATLQVIARLASQGVRIYGPKPTRTLSLTGLTQNNKALRALADKVWALPNVSTDVMSMHGSIVPDLKADGLSYIHRRTADGLDIYYIANPSYTETVTTEGLFRMTAPSASMWNPVDGSVTSIPAEQLRVQGSCTNIQLSLQPQQSLFVVFGKEQVGTAARHTEVSTMVISSSAKGMMHFDDDATISDQPIGDFGSLTTSADPAIKYYSGRVTYTLPVTLSRNQLAGASRVELSVPKFGSTARVIINGQYASTLWIPGGSVDITQYVRQGDNEIKIVVTNPWRNRLIGDLLHPEHKRTFTTSPTTMKLDPVPVVNPEAELLPSGISQPLKLIFSRIVE